MLSNSYFKILQFPGGLVVRICYFQCHGLASIPGQGNEIPQAIMRSQKKNFFLNKWVKDYNVYREEGFCGLNSVACKILTLKL